MKQLLQNLASKLTAIAVIVIIAYIGYNELFRSTGIDAELNQAITESRQAQADLRTVTIALRQQQDDLETAQQTITAINNMLGVANDSIAAINGRYEAISVKLNQQTAIALDRYTQQKKHIQDIQKQIR